MEQINITNAIPNTSTPAPINKRLRPVRLEDLCFAAVCGSCGYYSPEDPDTGWCRKHGGWVSPSKWACSDYT